MADLYDKCLDPNKDAKSSSEHAKDVVKRFLYVEPKEIALYDHLCHLQMAARWNDLRMHYVEYFRLPWYLRWWGWWEFKLGVEYHTRDIEEIPWPTPEEAQEHWDAGLR